MHCIRWRTIATDRVVWSVGLCILSVYILSVGHVRDCKNSLTDRDAIWVADSDHSRMDLRSIH